MSSNNILNSLRGSNLVNGLQEVAQASQTPMYETAVGMSAIKNVSANVAVLPSQSVSLASTVVSATEYTVNIPRNGFLHGIIIKVVATGAANNVVSVTNGGLFPHLLKCDILRGGQVVMPMNGAAALCYMSKYIEGNAVDRILEASLDNNSTLPTSATTCYLLVPFDFTFDKSLALDTLYMEQLQLRVSFSNNPFGSDLSLNDGASPTPASLGIASWGAASAIFHYYDLDPDVTSELRKNVYASSDAHAFLTNGWYNYSAISSAGPVNLNSQNLVKHIFYIVQTRNGALSTPTGSHTLTAGGQTLQQHESQSDAMIQRLVFAPKQNVFGNALGEVIGCFDLTNAQHTESDSYSGGISLRNIADPRLTCSSLTSARYFVVECYYNLVSVSSASGQVMVAATS
jgi:hypothetical protein